MKKMILSLNCMRNVMENGGCIYIRGAGNKGQNLLSELNDIGIKVDAFLDSDYEKQGKEICGVSVKQPDIIYEMPQGKYYILVAIDNDLIYSDIHKEYVQNGLKPIEDFSDFSLFPDRRLYDYSDILPSEDYYEEQKRRAHNCFEDMKKSSPDFCKTVPNEYNLIGDLDVPITTFCSLHCKYCSHCIPYSKSPRHFDCDEVLKDLNRVLSVSYVACIAIMGGEPFVHPKLAEFLDAYTRIENKANIGFTRIVTNGTVFPSEEVFRAMAKIENFQLYCSNYGNLSKENDRILDKCSDYGICTFVVPESSHWDFLGDFNYRRSYTSQQVKHLFSVCDARYCVQLMEGHLYSCPRTPLLNEEQLIPYCENDYCDIRTEDEESEELKYRIHEYLYNKPYLEGCYYCDGQHRFSPHVMKA